MILIIRNLISTSLRVFGNLLNKGHHRTLKAKRHILISFAVKVGDLAIGFVQLPLALAYVDKTSYGIWLVLSSIVAWFGFFDIGLGQGLRNKFAEALARNDKKSAQIFVSTTYAIISIIMIAMVILFIIINPFLNWNKILNIPVEFDENILLLVYIVFLSFAIRFVINLINNILLADQRPSISGLLHLIARVIHLLVLIILLKTTEGSLLYLALLYSFTTVIITILSSIYFYRNDYKEYIPSLKCVDFKYAKELVNIGIRFFIIQIAVLVVYATDNMIITQLFDPSHVTVYNIAQKYFSVVIMGFMLIVTPFWSAVTEAYHKNEFQWIKDTIRELISVWLLFFLLAVIMLICSGWVYKVWIRDPSIIIPFRLSVAYAIYVSIFSFVAIFIHFINGTGKIQLQIYVALFNMVFNIPLSVLFAKHLGFGITGVIMGTMVSSVLGLITAPLQYYKIINLKAKGVWNR